MNDCAARNDFFAIANARFPITAITAIFLIRVHPRRSAVGFAFRSRRFRRFFFLRRATIGFVENRSGIFEFVCSACDLSGEIAALVPQGCFAQHMVPIYSGLNAILMRNIKTRHLIWQGVSRAHVRIRSEEYARFVP
jgi:hypothetical protein